MAKISIVAEKAKYPGNLADELLHIKARIADLKEEEKRLQDHILATGEDVIEGVFARVTVSYVPDALLIDYRRAAEVHLNPAVLEQYTKFRQGTVRFNVRARRGDEEVAA